MSLNIQAGALGAVVGATLGVAVRGRRSFHRMSFYEPIPARMAPVEALEAWLVWSKHVRARKNPHTVTQSLLEHWEYPVDETAFGLANGACGFTAPLSGSFRNPLPNGSQAIGRAIYWGLAYHGQPDRASEFAYFDASIDHASEGVWVAVALARMVACAEPGSKPTELVRAATSILPKESATLRAIPIVLQGMNVADGPLQVQKQLATSLKIADAYDAVLTFGYALAGLLHANGSFDKAVLAAAGCGGASEHSCMAVGAISGLIAGEVPSEWSQPLGTSYVTGVGLRNIDPPANLSDFVKMVEDDYLALAPVEPKAEVPIVPVDATPTDETPVEEKPDETPVPTVEPAPTPAAPVKPSGPSPEIVSLMIKTPNETMTELDGVRLSVQYLDAPLMEPGVAVKTVLTFTNTLDQEVIVESGLTADNGWTAASRLTSFRLRPGESSSFPAVIQPPKESPKLGGVKLKVNRYELPLPLATPQKWYMVGPFVNQDGTGFDKVFPCEFTLNTDDVFNGRSDLPVKWAQDHYPGVLFDLEPLYRTGPGVIYLYAKMRFAKPGPAKLVVAGSPGVVVWWDAHRLTWYHDKHQVVPRPTPPYEADVQVGQENTLMIKVLRDREPMSPLVVYILGEDGKVISPVAFIPMAK